MIHEIPQESVRRLGSTQVITDPITVIKELVENALDAGATSIIVEASSDLVSHIQIKDNGCGIDPNDRNLMAKPHCTSKISKFDDLLDVTTLGFRGEALASLANVSGLLTIITRVKNEAMAVACEIASDGSLKTISPVSAPTGCTVKVTNLFSKFPVRKSTLEKTAAKYLGRIRPLLLSYYLTHPQTRLQFRCVAAPQGNKGKKKIETKYDVVFTASSTKEQAVIKAFGAESNRRGQWIESKAEDGDVHVEAFVVKPDADTNPISKKGVCVAYKNRPLSITRNQGLAHSIYSLYKKQTKLAFAARSVDAPTEPLLFLNILSSVGKVDVNIEPAKDDVLFESNERVIGCIKECFERVYGIAEEELRGKERTNDDFSSEATNDSVVPSEFPIEQTLQKAPTFVPEISGTAEQLLAETRSHAPSSSPPTKISSSTIRAQHQNPLGRNQTAPEEVEEDIPLTYSEVSQGRPNTRKQEDGWSFSMYGSGIDEDEDADFVDIEEIMKGTERQEASREEDTRKDKSISNPWTISKMNSRVTQQEKQADTPRAAPAARSPTVPLPSSPFQIQSEIQSRNPGAPNTMEIASLSSALAIANTPTSNTPITRMSERGNLWYPNFRSDNNTSSPNRRKRCLIPQRLSEAASNSSSRTTQQSARLPGAQKPVRKSAGPIDTWIGANKATEESHTSPLANDDHESATPLPISVLFGTPDLGTSNRPGDGGRGIFPSASDRMREERRATNPQIDEEGGEEISSSSENDEPRQPEFEPPKNARASASKLLISTGRSNPTKFPSTYKVSNKPSKPQPGTSKFLRDVEEKDVFPRKMKLLVTTLPKLDLRSLRFRARLIEDDLYDDDDEYETGETRHNELELRKPFFCFLKKYVDGADYSDDTELELLQEDILDGREFDLSFQNLASRQFATA
ncbi:hypothetical protein EYR41_008267 [Orbilia oligospora]|uniref:Uncharacterized protein n=1 Tax=Orbilia oligospora TaxID=2813651 RepID=A0A7C8P1Y6_ORBOL|nr:hypothetical protein TWF751_005522 [Orbilia oligospora]TGJ66657.1 hypothetical protein EYR41_008267 [Orbilia oligospora]